jgi:hypothetical protein
MYEHFGRTRCIYFQGATVDVEVVRTSETMAFTRKKGVTSHEAAFVIRFTLRNTMSVE